MAAVLDLLLDGLVAQIASLSLSLDGTAVRVERQKVPKVERGLEQVPFISVSGAASPGPVSWWSTGGSSQTRAKRRHAYVAVITLTAPGNRDPQTNEDTYLQWRQSIMRALEPPSVLGVDELYDVELEPDAPIDPGGYPKNYDTSRINLRLITIEPST